MHTVSESGRASLPAMTERPGGKEDRHGGERARCMARPTSEARRSRPLHAGDPSSRWRTGTSITTTALSTSRPTPSAMPPRPHVEWIPGLHPDKGGDDRQRDCKRDGDRRPYGTKEDEDDPHGDDAPDQRVAAGGRDRATDHLALIEDEVQRDVLGMIFSISASSSFTRSTAWSVFTPDCFMTAMMTEAGRSCARSRGSL